MAAAAVEALPLVAPFEHTYFDLRVRHACVACHWNGNEAPPVAMCTECDLPTCAVGRDLRRPAAAAIGGELACHLCGLACAATREARQLVRAEHAAACAACRDASEPRDRRTCPTCAMTWCARCEARVAAPGGKHAPEMCARRSGALVADRVVYMLEQRSGEDLVRLQVLVMAQWLHQRARAFAWPSVEAPPAWLPTFVRQCGAFGPAAPMDSIVARLRERLALDALRQQRPTLTPAEIGPLVRQVSAWSLASRGVELGALALAVTLADVDASAEASFQALLALNTYAQHCAILMQKARAVGREAARPTTLAGACYAAGLVHDALAGYAYAGTVVPAMTPGALWRRDMGPEPAGAPLNACYLVTVLDVAADADADATVLQLLVHLFAAAAADDAGAAAPVTLTVLQGTAAYGLGAWLTGTDEAAHATAAQPQAQGRAAVAALADALETWVDPASTPAQRRDACRALTGCERPLEAFEGPFRLVTLRMCLNA